jgi:hypothetical protein
MRSTPSIGICTKSPLSSWVSGAKPQRVGVLGSAPLTQHGLFSSARFLAPMKLSGGRSFQKILRFLMTLHEIETTFVRVPNGDLHIDAYFWFQISLCARS